jgi:hypothetical protein
MISLFLKSYMNQKKFFARDEVRIPREIIAKMPRAEASRLELVNTVGFRSCLE